MNEERNIEHKLKDTINKLGLVGYSTRIEDENTIVAKKNNKCVMYRIDNGTVYKSKEYDKIDHIKNSNISIIKDSNKNGLIKNDGFEIIIAENMYFDSIFDKLILETLILNNDSYSGILDLDGNEIVDSKYSDIIVYEVTIEKFIAHCSYKSNNEYYTIDINNGKYKVNKISILSNNDCLKYAYEDVLVFQNNECYPNKIFYISLDDFINNKDSSVRNNSKMSYSKLNELKIYMSLDM